MPYRELGPQCLVCKWWVSPFDRDDADAEQSEPVQVCAAFPLPDGIPGEIWRNQADHRKAYPGDSGIQFVALPGERFPKFALAPPPPAGTEE